MRRALPLVFAAALFCALAIPAVAQLAASAVEIEEVEISDHPNVLVLVTAPPEYSALDLGAEDWILTEDGVPQEVVNVARVGGTSIEVVLVLDTSGSMQGAALDQAVAAAESFLDRLPAGSRVALVTFGGASRVASEFSADLELIRESLVAVSATGETALYDGIVDGARLFSEGDDIRKSLVVLTDGADTVSASSETQAALALRGAGATFFAVELQTDETAAEPLAQLAASAGGLKIGATAEELAAAYDGIASRIVSQYILGYVSTGSGRVTLGVRVGDEGEVEPATLGVRLPISGSVGTTPGPTSPSSTVAPGPPGTLPGFEIDVPQLGEKNVIWFGLGAVFVGIAVLLLYLIQPGEGGSRSTVRPSFRTSRQRAVSSMARGLVGAADRAAASGGRVAGLDRSLERAGINLRAGEYLVLAGLVILVSFGFGLAFLPSPILAVLVAAVAGVVAIYFLTFMGNRRQRAFENQLPDALSMLASTIRTGYAPLQATELVARETAKPAHDELSRVVAEARLGRDYIDAMAAAAARTQSSDLQWVVEAMGINRDVGGDVSELLDNVAETIRSRIQLKRMIAALSAEGRLSAWVLILLPFGLTFFINISNPGYLRPLIEHPFGIIMIIGAVISMGLGIFFISKILDLEA